jgi:hypothetical protein
MTTGTCNVRFGYLTAQLYRDGRLGARKELTVAITDLFDRGWRANPAKAAARGSFAAAFSASTRGHRKADEA